MGITVEGHRGPGVAIWSRHGSNIDAGSADERARHLPRSTGDRVVAREARNGQRPDAFVGRND